MTDQIYYKVQYPVKKAINVIKNVDPHQPLGPDHTVTESDVEEIRDFLRRWEAGGKDKLEGFVYDLRKNN